MDLSVLSRPILTAAVLPIELAVEPKKRHFFRFIVDTALCLAIVFSTQAVNITTWVNAQAVPVQIQQFSVFLEQDEVLLPEGIVGDPLWQYLRAGLNYLETSGKDLSPSFVHPGGKAYGALGLTPIAVEDVKQSYPQLSEFSSNEVFTKGSVYEAFARSYAELLLTRYIKIDYRNTSKEEVFNVLQKAWFWGPALYKKEGNILLSREKKSQDYIVRTRNIL